jgi:hypothetical protein
VTSPPTITRVAPPQKGGGLPSHFGPNHEWRTARGAEDDNTSRGARRGCFRHGSEPNEPFRAGWRRASSQTPFSQPLSLSLEILSTPTTRVQTTYTPTLLGLPSHFGPNHEWRTARGAEDDNTSRGARRGCFRHGSEPNEPFRAGWRRASSQTPFSQPLSLSLEILSTPTTRAHTTYTPTLLEHPFNTHKAPAHHLHIHSLNIL